MAAPMPPAAPVTIARRPAKRVIARSPSPWAGSSERDAATSAHVAIQTSGRDRICPIKRSRSATREGRPMTCGCMVRMKWPLSAQMPSNSSRQIVSTGAGSLDRAIHLSRTEGKIRPIVEEPLDRQLDQGPTLMAIGADIGHELAGICETMSLSRSSVTGLTSQEGERYPVILAPTASSALRALTSSRSSSVRRELSGRRMRVAMDRHFVALGDHPLHQFGIELGVAADDEERRPDAVPGECVEDEGNAHPRAIGADGQRRRADGR